MKKAKFIFLMLTLVPLLISCQSKENPPEESVIPSENTLVDTMKPTIYGVKDTSIIIGDSFDVLSGITAFDDIDGELTSSIEVIGVYDTQVIGTYTITYSVSDKTGNAETVSMILTVNPDTSLFLDYHGVTLERYYKSELFNLYIDQSTNHVGYDPIYIIYKSDQHIEYISSTLLVHSLYVQINDEIYSFEEAIFEEMIKYQDVASISKLGYHNIALVSDSRLLETVHLQQQHISTQVNPPQLSQQHMKMMSNRHMINPNSINPYNDWPNKYEWYEMTYQLYDLLEILILNGYIEGTLVKIKDFSHDHEYFEYHSYYIRDDYSIIIKEDNYLLEVVLIREVGYYYEYNDVYITDKSISYIEDGELIIFSMNQIFDSNYVEIYRYLEEFREHSGVARTSYDQVFNRYYSHIYSGITIDNLNHVSRLQRIDRYGNQFNSYQVNYKNHDDVIYLTVNFEDHSYDYHLIYFDVNAFLEQVDDINYSVIRTVKDYYYIMKNTYFYGYYLDTETHLVIRNLFNLEDGYYLWFNEDLLLSYIEPVQELHAYILEFERLNALETLTDEETLLFNSLIEKLDNYQLGPRTYHMLTMRDGKLYINHNYALEATYMTYYIESIHNKIFQFKLLNSQLGVSNVLSSMDFLDYFSGLINLDPNIIEIRYGKIPSIDPYAFFSSLEDEQDYWNRLTQVQITYDEAIDGDIPNQEDIIKEHTSGLLQQVKEIQDVFIDFFDIPYQELTEETFITYTDLHGYSFSFEKNLNE